MAKPFDSGLLDNRYFLPNFPILGWHLASTLNFLPLSDYFMSPICKMVLTSLQNIGITLSRHVFQLCEYGTEAVTNTAWNWKTSDQQIRFFSSQITNKVKLYLSGN